MNKKLIEAVRKMRRRIKDRNRKFRKLTLRQQRIKVVRDVIRQLSDGTLVASPGTYAKFIAPKRMKPDSQLNEILESIPKCEVCGVGGIFLATVKLNNELTVEDVNRRSSYGTITAGVRSSMGDSVMRDYLKKWFSAEQLALIETAFERRKMHSAFVHPDKPLQAAIKFGMAYENPKARFIAICNNIIEHGGEFVVE